MGSLLWMLVVLLALGWAFGLLINVGAWVNFLLVLVVVLILIGPLLNGPPGPHGHNHL